jgi:hypothetical protein
METKQLLELTVGDPAPVPRDTPERALRGILENYWSHHDHEAEEDPDADENGVEYVVADTEAKEKKAEGVYCNYLVRS